MALPNLHTVASSEVVPQVPGKASAGADGNVNGLSSGALTHLQNAQSLQSSSITACITSDGTRGPFPYPTGSSKPPHAKALTPEQQSDYEELLSIANKWVEIPNSSKPGSTKSLLTDSERMWLTKECLLRYLRASKWVIPTASTRLQATLTWRREWGLEGHTAEYISPENETGKQVINGYDKVGRPCLYLNPHRQNTKRSEKQLHHLVFMLERCIDLMPPGQETLALLINFSKTRQGQGSSPAQGIQTTSILQNHYPERLGIAIVQEVPWYIKIFFKAINPFIDPQTREKLKFDWDLKELIPHEQLLMEFGGDVDFVYEHESYWPTFIGLAEGRRREAVRRWTEAGKRVGESEGYLKGEGPPAEDKMEGGAEEGRGSEAPAVEGI